MDIEKSMNTYSELQEKIMRNIYHLYKFYENSKEEILINLAWNNYHIYFKIDSTRCNAGILFNHKAFRIYSEPKQNQSFLIKDGKRVLIMTKPNLPLWLQRIYDKLDTLVEEEILKRI